MNLDNILEFWGITSEIGTEFAKLTLLILTLIIFCKIVMIIWAFFTK